MGQQSGAAPSEIGRARGATRRRRHCRCVGQGRGDRGAAGQAHLFARNPRLEDDAAQPAQRERLGYCARRTRAVVARAYVPDAGDLVWLTFDPQAGHEQRGRRPALILSSRLYNAKALLAIACPITSQVKGYPFEVPLPAGGKISGVVLADHIKNLDWQARRGVFEEKAPADILTDVRERLRVLLGL